MRERAKKERLDNERDVTNEKILVQLYSHEAKIKVGQERAKNYQDENIKGKAENHNRRVEEVKG